MVFALLSFVVAVFTIASGSVCIFFSQEIQCKPIDMLVYFAVSVGFLAQAAYLTDISRG
jgi:hypothetical protein